MGGSATFESEPVSLGRRAKAVIVAKFDDISTYTILPNVVPISVESAEGANPGTAMFRYVFRDAEGASLSAPSRFEEVYPLSATGEHVVKNDDRICVFEVDEDGFPAITFDGFAQIPQLDLSGRSQDVSFQALGVPVRCWDSKVGGAIYRSAFASAASPPSDTKTDLPVRFNPDGKGNCQEPGFESGDDPEKYQVFMDLLAKASTERVPWTIATAIKYLLATENPRDIPVEGYIQWVENPDFGMLTGLLDSRRPKEGKTFMDPGDSSTYDSDPIKCPDFDAKGKPWPEVVEQLLAPHGFGMAFRLEDGEPLDDGRMGKPYHYLEIYRKDDAGDGTLKSLLLQPPGSVLDPARSNLGQAHLARSLTDLANEVEIDTAPTEYEASFILMPAFEIAVGDAAATDAYILDSPGFAAHASTYRDYILDETGEGHWNYDEAEIQPWPADLKPLFGKEHVIRRRPAQGSECFSRPSPGAKPYKVQLWISTDFVPGDRGSLWNALGTWQPVLSGWELLKDRCGIRLTSKDVEKDWNIGASKTAGHPFPSGKVRGVTCQANPDAAAGVPLFFLRLTCVIQGDKGLGVTSERRPTSPTKFTIRHVDEQRDRFVRRVISPFSHFAPVEQTQDVDDRNDTDAAKAHADARRLAHELGPIAGSVTIPRLTTAYRIGDRVSKIAGREPDVDLRTNVGGDQKEAPVYPSIVKITRQYSPQAVTLHLSDRRAEPARRRQN